MAKVSALMPLFWDHAVWPNKVAKSARHAIRARPGRNFKLARPPSHARLPDPHEPYYRVADYICKTNQFTIVNPFCLLTSTTMRITLRQSY